MTDRIARKVLLITWSGADWQVIHPLLDAGQMPHLGRLLETGVLGAMSTLEPQVASYLWTTVATGKLGHQHGVLSLVEPDPHGSAVRPVSAVSRTCSAIWNILSESGIASSVLGWPMLVAERVDGVCVSELFPRVGNTPGQRSTVPPDAIYPQELAQTLSQMRVHPHELSWADVEPFFPTVKNPDSVSASATKLLATVLAEWSGLHAAATWVMEHRCWEFMAVHYDAIDRLSHAFMLYHPPRPAHVSPALFARFQNVVNQTYRLSDMMLGRLLELAGPETTIILVSEHGFLSGVRRPVADLPGRSNTSWHRQEGILAMAGPGVRCDEYIWGAQLPDVAPTILRLFGLPPANDMDGGPLLQALQNQSLIERIPSWDRASSGRYAWPTVDDVSQEAVLNGLARLEDHGYFEVGELSVAEAPQHARETIQANLAAVLLRAGGVRRAESILKQLVAENPTHVEYALQLARASLRLGKTDDCRQIVERILPFVKREGSALHLLGSLECTEGNFAQALTYLLQAEQAGSSDFELHCQIGEVYIRLEKWRDAELAFNKALNANHDSARAYAGLTIVHLNQQHYRVALDTALTAIGIRRDEAIDHYHLAIAFANTGEPQRAIMALEQCLKLQPKLVVAHRLLADLCETAIRDTARASAHRELAHDLEAQRSV